MDAPAIVAKVAQNLLRRLNDDWRQRQQDWVQKCTLESAQVGTAIGIAVLSAALGREPFEPEVQSWLSQLMDDPGAPARLRRLFGEALNTPRQSRRQRLAAVLFGGPSAVPRAADLDRLDLLVSALLDEDVLALAAMRSEDRGQGVFAHHVGPRDAPRTNEFVLTSRAIGKAAAMNQDPALVDKHRHLSAMVLDSLRLAGCIDVSGALSDMYGPVLQEVKLRLPGTFLLDALSREPIATGLATPLDP
jgi:hypothetical protein